MCVALAERNSRFNEVSLRLKETGRAACGNQGEGMGGGVVVLETRWREIRRPRKGKDKVPSKLQSLHARVYRQQFRPPESFRVGCWVGLCSCGIHLLCCLSKFRSGLR